MRELPSGTVTFLFTDIEGSTQAAARARQSLRVGAGRASARVAGRVRGVRRGRGRYAGGRILCAFAWARGRLAAAARDSRRLLDGPIRVRMGLHTGEPIVPRRATSASTSTGPLGSRPLGTAARFSLSAVDARTRRVGRLARPRRAPAQGLRRPGRVFQLGERRFRRLRALQRPISRPASPFVGRRGRLAEFVGFSRTEPVCDSHRPGGLRARHALPLRPRPSRPGVQGRGLLVRPCPPFATPTRLPTVAQRSAAVRPGRADRGPRAALLIDNLEQVVEAGPGARRARRVLPDLGCSRQCEPLRVRGEGSIP